MTTISIDPVTRLEGHARIDIHLDELGRVDACALVVPELRGFERFAEGRPVEEMPRITSHICGVCPEAHHAAGAKAVDAVFQVVPPPAAQIIRRLQYNAFVAGDHATHFYALGGPDLVLGPDTPVAQRNLVGLFAAVGAEAAGDVLRMRRESHEVAEMLGGRRINPVGMIAGGQSKAVTREMQTRLCAIGEHMVDFSRRTIDLFHRAVLSNAEVATLMLSEVYRLETYSMGLVNSHDEPDVYDGDLRVVDPSGHEVARFAPSRYLEHIEEQVEPWTYLKFPFLRKIGWRGLDDGPGSGVYRVGPLAMLNASRRMQTPEAQAEREQMESWFGGFPIHSVLAYHWARIIEMTQCAELMLRLARSEGLVDPEVHRIPSETPREGVGVVEAPRGILVHHYLTDERGIVRRANLIVGTTHNHAAIAIAVARAARGVIRRGVALTETQLNRIEMAFRPFDPCLGCATHLVDGPAPLVLRVLDHEGRLVDEQPARGPGGAP
jgi:F420-non-reducing hydrogenase large subunit